MRVLFCFVGGSGHFEPMVPLVQAAQRLGHTVAVACGPTPAPAVRAAGFTALVIGRSATAARRPRLPLLPVDEAREERDFRDRFADRAARLRSEGALALLGAWHPDVVVADEADFGTLLAAERLGVPYATVLVAAAGALVRPDVVAGTLDRVRAEHGLPADPDLTAASRYLVLSPFPAILRDPTIPFPSTTHHFRSAATPRTPDAPPPWPRHLAGAPNVYFTLGTEFNVESGDLFSRVLAGLDQLPANVLVTVGRQISPEELGPQPANVHVERYRPQAEVLPYCDLVVFHGGSGTLTGALAHGRPVVVLAMGADQPANGRRCQALGLGVSLDPFTVSPDEVHRAATTVLHDPSYRHAAQRIGDQIVTQPDPSAAVALLERLAADREPLPAGGSCP